MKITCFSLFLASLLLQSCITIKQSLLRSSTPKVIKINNCKISFTGAVYMNVFGIIKAEFLPASIKIDATDQLIYFVPVVVNDTSKANFILKLKYADDLFLAVNCMRS